MPNDSWSEKLERVYPGAVVNKSIAQHLEATKLPRFVAEYLIAMFCRDDDVEEGIRQINEQLRLHMPERKQKNLVKDRLSQRGEYKLIDRFKVEVSLARTESQTHKVNIPSLGIRDAYVYRDILDAHPRLLTDGVWGRGRLIYTENKEIHLVDFKPFQLSNFSLGGYIEGRPEFTTDEWINVLVSSVGLNPYSYAPDERMLIISRLIPMAEINTHMLELGPPGTGKTYTFDKISAYARVISGSVISPAALFYNANTRTAGILALYDAVVFDEIDKVGKGMSKEVVNKLLKFMESGKYDRLGMEIPSGASVILVGNLPEGLEEDFDKLPCFQLLPEAMQHKAFFDRLAGFIPGWQLAVIKGSEKHLSNYYGFAADYFCEVLHGLREQRDYQYIIDQNVTLKNVTIRDEKSVKKLTSGLLKLLFPKKDESSFSPEEIKLCIQAAIGYRQRVIDQRHIMHRDPKDDRQILYELV
jgi:ATP-dependent Lon protease